MARDTSKLVTIPGELHSAATGNIVAATQEIFDYDSNSYQSQLNKQVYNVSAHDSSATAKYTFDEAIAAVPASYHVGGLILTFVSKEGDFEMYQLKSTEWTDDTDKWGIIKTAIVKDNPEFVEVHLDGSDKILYGVQKDGNFYFGGGVPSQVKEYVDEKSAETDRKIDELKEEIDSSINVNIEKIEEEISALDANTKADIARLDSSVSSGFARVDASILELGYYEENPEYAEAHIDASSRLLYGVQKDGNFYFGGGVPSQVKEYVDEKSAETDRKIDELKEEIDSSINVNIEKIEEEISALDANTKADIARLDSSVSSGFARVDASILELGYYEENPEYAEAHIDASSRLLYGVQKDGNFYFGGGVPRQVTEYFEDRLVDIDASIMDVETRFYNVNAHDGSVGINYTLEEAIAAVPEAYRKGGLILTFNSDGSNGIYQCKIDEFSDNVKDWIQYVDKEYVDSSVSPLTYKTNDILRLPITDDSEQIVLATDDNVEVTSISVEKTSDDSEILEFKNESETETYAKIGVIDDKKGLFVNNLYDLNGNHLLTFDSSNDILILGGKKYKMIPYIEET